MVLTEEEFTDAFTACGGRFFENTYEYIADNLHRSTNELADVLFGLGYDSRTSGTRVRVSSSKRLIGDDGGLKALVKVATSDRISEDAVMTAKRILRERFHRIV